MGHKVHPTGIRLGIAKDWNSKWYANKREYAGYLTADLKVREMLRERLAQADGRIALTVELVYGHAVKPEPRARVAPETRVDLLDASEASFDRLISINLKGPFFLTQQAARWMIEQSSQRPADAPRLKIITISSISAYTASITTSIIPWSIGNGLIATDGAIYQFGFF